MSGTYRMRDLPSSEKKQEEERKAFVHDAGRSFKGTGLWLGMVMHSS